jgi:hypothetical protein
LSLSNIEDRETGDPDPFKSTTSSLGEVMPVISDIVSLPHVTDIETSLENT